MWRDRSGIKGMSGIKNLRILLSHPRLVHSSRYFHAFSVWLFVFFIFIRYIATNLRFSFCFRAYLVLLFFFFVHQIPFPSHGIWIFITVLNIFNTFYERCAMRIQFVLLNVFHSLIKACPFACRLILFHPRYFFSPFQWEILFFSCASHPFVPYFVINVIKTETDL